MKKEKTAKTKIKKGRSIGMKVFVIIAILIITYIALVESNISALYKINDFNTTLSDVYIKAISLEGESTTRVEQIRMYSYEVFQNFFQDDISDKISQLDESIASLEEKISELETLAGLIDKTEIVGCVNDYINDVKNYCEFTKAISADAVSKNKISLSQRIKEIDEYYDNVKASQEEFSKDVHEAVDEIEEHTIIRVDGTRIFNIVMLLVFVVIAIISIIIMLRTVSRPAKISSNLMRDIVQKIDEGEGDLTERIPVKAPTRSVKWLPESTDFLMSCRVL